MMKQQQILRSRMGIKESLSKELRIDPFGNCVTRIRMESVRYSENHSNYYKLKDRDEGRDIR